jgi:RNA polymerase sigma factor (sigma-70 family)
MRLLKGKKTKDQAVNQAQTASDVLDIYYSDLSKVSVLHKDIEFRLLQEYVNPSTSSERKSTILKQVVESNLKLVFSLAKYLWKDQDKNTLQELISAGNEGLVAAVNKFDPSYKVRLCTYAGHWINMHMRKVQKGPVKVPVDKVLPKYVDSSIVPEGSYSEDYDSLLSDDKDSIATWLRFLSERERFIVERSYGLNPFDPISLKEIGKKLNLSSERVRQIRTAAVEKLKYWTKY